MDAMGSTIVIQILHGLAYGMLLFLVASGLTLVFGMMSVLNLAHASFYMLGAYFSYQMLKWIGNFWIGLIVCPILVAFLGILMERFLLRRVHAGGHVQEFVLTAGIAFVVMEAVKWIWGTEPLPVPIPAAPFRVGQHHGKCVPGLPPLHPLLLHRGPGFHGLHPDEDPAGHYGSRGGFRPGHGQRPGDEYPLRLHAGHGHRHLAGRTGRGHCRAFHQHLPGHGRGDPGGLFRGHRDRGDWEAWSGRWSLPFSSGSFPPSEFFSFPGSPSSSPSCSWPSS